MRPAYLVGAAVLAFLLYLAVRRRRKRNRRTVGQSLGGTIGLHSRLVAQKISQDGSEAVRVVDASNKSAADVTPAGDASFELEGKPVLNESRSLGACRILIERLNREGGGWSDPRQPLHEHGVDCESTGPQGILEIQVTQAANESRFWADLSRSGRGSSAGSTADIAQQLWNAIDKKAKKIPHAQRGNLTLALDASLSAAQALPPVLSEFRAAYSREAAALGFREVWIVGPTPDLCARLDE